MIDPSAPSALAIGEKLVRGGKLWLFLDYDGTLADFAPTPDVVLPDPDLINLLNRLAQFPQVLRVVILSGRPLSIIQELLPVPGILVAGTYGIEFVDWQGKPDRLLDFETSRPFLDTLKQSWVVILAGRTGFFLEDKGYALAIHARFAADAEWREVLAQAARAANAALQKGAFRLLQGNRFLEVAPLIANKGQSVSTLLQRFPWPGADFVYLGDDDKDEEAFAVVIAAGGSAIRVADQPGDSLAQHRLKNPQAVRRWLAEIVDVLENGFPKWS